MSRVNLHTTIRRAKHYLVIASCFFGGVSLRASPLGTVDFSPEEARQSVMRDTLPQRKAEINLVLAPVRSIPTDASNFALPREPLYLKPTYPVAQQIVENYRKSGNKKPGGHCLVVSKERFEQAYRDVYGRRVYNDLPDSIATKQLTPQQVFHNLYNTATKASPEWKNLPRKYRAKGNAGALAIADFGEILDTESIWKGRLRPGALVQVWRLQEDYEKVRSGVEVTDFDPYGHSFIFLGYERNRKGEIEGMNIADQGYQSYRPLVPRDYEIWWGVNIEI